MMLTPSAQTKPELILVNASSDFLAMAGIVMVSALSFVSEARPPPLAQLVVRFCNSSVKTSSVRKFLHHYGCSTY